ncbi:MULTISPECIES: methyl-accepting chemotaxis protein [Pseudomonas syringae group]|uniref:Methyl-accepting chemotaxis protein n=5 Tax=Pseudomonas syringae group TaxID=136849 RepID=A0A3M5G453_PSESS|nr:MULTISPECIES: methyl-accepting chemotaxis protein [Pseudomonas syringae group]KPX02366.1 Methyl-accepting chemotaxis protein [Pseudomonas syringae pv. cunninghamiae]PPS31497.1 methyl-accepting chemotaxis protein [Pseudomonas amygdali pv. morsprunorum]KPW89418.1 Methyl-accepting chemotaxis protein [Pseudomonas syringae pv. castaneae]KPX16155.1 Methyl-accepting chemotaxis protein [Pseudomonas amygdali pv. dendropanacis]KPX32910.1 Methyl-accepting chemotaxis protein [Pseudomonas amygdali pv. e
MSRTQAPHGGFNIKQRLMASTFAIIVAFIALSFFMIHTLKTSTENVDALYNRDFLATEAVNNIDGALTRVDINILRMIAIGNPEQTAGWKNENEAAFAKLDELTVLLGKNTAETLDVTLTQQLQRDYTKLRDGMRHQTSVIQTGDIAAATNINRTEVKPFAEQVFKTLQTLREQGKQKAGERFDAQEASATRTNNLSITATLLIAVLGVVVTLLTIRSILAAIGGEPDTVATITRTIARGDLSSTIKVNANDNTSVAAAVVAMQTQLRDTLQQISNSATQLAAAAEEMTAITEDGVQGIQRQNNEIDQAATAVNEMTSAVEEVARNAEHTARSSSNATSAAQAGLGLVKKTVSAINTMSTDVQKTAVLIGELADQSRDIGKVLDVIRGLAEQTNLLALNAAIEAARAGEAGRGFAVVADEVRALAHRTQQSTSEIERLVSNIQNGTDRAVSSMRGNTELASDTLSIAEGANDSLSVISTAVSEINDLNLVIASAAQQQAHVAREVDRNLVNIRDLSAQSSSGAQQTSSASRELSTLALDLNNIVGRFRLS